MNPYGITIHSIYGISLPVDYFLRVDWQTGDGPPNGGDDDGGDHGDNPGANPGSKPGDGGDDSGSSDKPGDGNATDYGPVDEGDNGNEQPGNEPSGNGGQQAVAAGTMNLRNGANPSGRIIGWVSRGTRFKILGEANSPAGYLWYEIQTVSGKRGWVWSHWVRPT